MMVGPAVPERSLTVECNGVVCGEYVYDLNDQVKRLELAVPQGAVRDEGLLDLRLRVSPDATPRMAGINSDGRSLGVALIELSISEEQ